MTLQMIKLVTGEVVLGEADSSVSPTRLTLLRPMTMMLDPMQGGVGMIPHDAIYTQEEVKSKTFKMEHIIDSNMKIHSTFEDAYIKQTTETDSSDSDESVAQEIIA